MGSIGKRHIQIIRDLYPNISIAVLRHERCDNAESSGVDHCFTSMEDALSYEPNVAIIANPAPFHICIAKQLAQARVHILIEKPISIDFEGVQELIDLCRETNIILMTAYNLRFLPSLRELKKQLHENKIGKLYSIRAEVGQYLPSWRPDIDYRKTVSAQKKLGGGVLLELSHEIDYLLWLFGTVEWVFADLSQQSNLDIDVEDTAHLIFAFKQDTNNRQLLASLSMDFIRIDPVRNCIVTGEHGTLRWDGIAGKVECYSVNESKWKLLYSETPVRDYTYIEEIKHFISCVEHKNKPFVSADDGMKVLAVIDAARQSNQTR